MHKETSYNESHVPVAQENNLRNFHWVLGLLLIAPAREYLYLKFDPVCDRH